VAKDYYRGLTVQFEGDTTKVSSALGALNKDIRQSQSAARALDTALKLDPQGLGLIKDRAEVTSRQIETMRKRVDVLKSALSEAKDPEVITRLNQQSDIAEAKLKSLTEDLIKLNVQAAKQNGFGAVVSGVQELGTTLSGVGDKMTEMGGKLTMGITAPVAALTATSVSAATTIDSALTDVRKTVDATEQEYQALKDAAIEYSKTNAVSADEVLQVQALGAQLGYTVDELEMIGRVGTGLDIATNMNAEQATTELAQFANITGMAHDKSENYASTIVALGNTMATTESKTSSMAQRVAAAGSQIGMSESEILGFSAALSSMGIEAEAGGTAISTIMSNIDKDVATNSDGLKTWAAAAGMTADEFANAWRTKPADALASLLSGLGSATEAGGNMSVMLEQLGIDSVQQTDMMKRLAGNSDLLTKAVNIANTAWQENTALTKEVENRNDSLEAKMQMVQNRITAMLEKIGKPVADALLDIIDAAEPLFDLIESGAKAFSDMDESQQRMIVSAVAAAAALGPMLSVGGNLVKQLGEGVSVIGSFGEGLLNFSEATKAGFSTMEALQYATEGATVSMSSLASALPVVAGALMALDIANSVKAVFDEFALIGETATSASEIAAQASSSLDGYTQSADAAASSTVTLSSVIEEANSSLRETAKYYDDVADSLGELASNTSAADEYTSTMKELANAGELNEQQQARLANAVEEYNEITGAAIEITDALNGTLNVLPDQIDEITEAYKRQAEQQAYTELYNEAIKEQARQQAELKRVTQEFGEAANNAGSMLLNALNPASVTRNASEVIRLTSSYDALKAGVARAASDVEYFGNKLGSSSTKFSTVQAAMTAAGYTGAQYTSLTESQLAEISAAFDGTINSIAAKLSSFGVSVGGTGSAAAQSAKNIADDVTNALSTIPSTGNNVLNSLNDLADDGGAVQDRANDDAIKAQQKANEKALKQQQKAFDQEYKLLQKELAAQLKQRQKEYAAEEDELRKSNEKKLKELRKQNDEEEAELKKVLDARVEARKKSLDAEIDAQKKANDAQLKALKKAQADATKAFKAETNARIKEMEREYKAQVKYLEDNDGTKGIDARIKQLEAETEAEKRAQTEQERQEKISDLQREVDKAKSRRRRAEAEKALNDYLAEIAAEQREQERQDEIDRLEEQKSLIKEETDARKEELKERYDNEKEQYQEARDAEAEAKAEQDELAYEKLKESLEKELELRKENNQQIIDTLKERYQAQIDSMTEQHDLEEEKRKEQYDAQLKNMREQHSEELEIMRESQQEQLDALKESQQEQLDAMREAQQEALDAMRDSYGQQAGAARAGGAAVASEAGAAAKQTADNIRDGLAPAVPETKKTAEQLRAEFLSKINEMPGDAYKTGDTSGHTLVERLNAHVMPTTDATKALRNAALRGIEGLPKDMDDKGDKGGNNLASKLKSHEGDTNSASRNLYDAAMGAVGGFPSDFGQKGEEASSQFSQGVGAYRSEAEQTASDMAQSVTNNLDEPKNWTYNSGSEAGQNFFEGLQSWADSIWQQAYDIADGISQYLHFTVPDKGPLHDEDKWGAHLIENYAEAMRSKAYLLEDESERMARIVEDGFTPNLAMRYDASLNYQRGSYVSAISGGGTTVGKQEISVNVDLHDVSLSSDMDIRNVSREIATQTAAELAAQLG